MVKEVKNMPDKKTTQEKGRRSLVKKVFNGIVKTVEGVSTAVKTLVVGVILGIAMTISGISVYLYKQFHKSPEQVRQETAVMVETVGRNVPKKIEKGVGKTFGKEASTNEVTKNIGGLAGRVAKLGVKHGGFVREKIAKAQQKEKENASSWI